MVALWWALWVAWIPLRWVGTDSLKTPESLALSPSGTLWVRWHGDSVYLGHNSTEDLFLVAPDPPLLGAAVSDSGLVLLVRRDTGTATLLEAWSPQGRRQWRLRVPPLIGLHVSQDSRWLLAGTPQGIWKIAADRGTVEGRYPLAPVYQARGPYVALAEGFRVSLYRDTVLLWQIPLGTNRVRALYFTPTPGFLLLYTAQQMILLDSTGRVLRNEPLPGEYQAGFPGPAGPVVSWKDREVVGIFWWNPEEHRFERLLQLQPYWIGQKIRLTALGARGDTLWMLHNAKLVRFAVRWPDHAGP